MGTTIERIRDACKSRGIAVSALERDLGYSNGYLNPKKARDVSGKRLVEIADYIGVSVSYLLGEEEKAVPYEEDGESIRIREILRERPEMRILFDAGDGAPTSAILEAAAQLMRYKEGKQGK